MSKLEWQPIETAPKDRRVLLWSPFINGGAPVCGNWDEDEYSNKPNPYWDNDLRGLFGKLSTRRHAPTHWAELPEAPNAITDTKAVEVAVADDAARQASLEETLTAMEWSCE